ncbi:hypothetical protein CEW83_01180 [Parazoarcus communis]|uniref:DUF3348 domain-containing protein n=1 Tax=Parazoarcus communis TaxID=41977 RepID=A0A2U8GND7_9RHOO|nr:DUF3348 domain-containing protein [Parazoarcus communis]AWI74005.1 hypothetical protein CEW83_01180 [Parazoarcus communis]
MTQALPRTSFTRSGLVRALADLAAEDVPESRQSFAERVGQWLDFKDALPLYSVLNPGTSGAAVQGSGTAPPEYAALREEFDRVRAALADSIVADGVFRPGKARIELPTPVPNAPVESAAEFSPYRRYYLAHQRDMQAGIAPLRTSARAALSRHSPALQHLAALDAVLDQALATRERTLLSTVSSLLAKRFEHLYAAHQAAQAEAQAEDDPSRWMEPGGWLAVFCREMQAVLLAELDTRLQPVSGLIEALHNEVTG